jgi:hypothetical protein
MGGLVRGIVQGLSDGAVIVGAQIATRKLATAAASLLPAVDPATANATTEKAKFIGFRLGAAVAVSIAARKFAPKVARIAAAGAFGEAINAGLAQTGAAKFLGALPGGVRRVVNVDRSGYNVPAGRRVNAWPRQNRAGVGAWPQMQVVGQ